MTLFTKKATIVLRVNCHNFAPPKVSKYHTRINIFRSKAIEIPLEILVKGKKDTKSP